MDLVGAESPPGEAAALLDELAERGVVLDYVLFSRHAPGDEFATHREAAVTTLLEVERRSDPHWFSSDPAGPNTGRRISVGEFVGGLYDHGSGRIIDDYNRWRMFFGLIKGAGRNPQSGYAEAFAHAVPVSLVGPYSRHDFDEASALFRRTNEILFGGLTDELVVYEWSTEWSDYFDLGREYWGTYLWTVEQPGSERIVGIAGSTTD